MEQGPDIDVQRGADETIALVFTDPNDPTPLDSAVLYFAVKKSEEDSTAIFAKNSGTPTEITITSDTTADLFIDEVNTDGEEPGTFKYDIWRVKGGKQKPMVLPGRFIISERITDVP
jgi:hypothetical protein